MMLRNPFNLTKANDLSDEQIQEFWVDIAKPGSLNSTFVVQKFASKMPTFILGSKGSGKTHLMRYASFSLQKKRFEKKGFSFLKGAQTDGYVGIYILCSGLETGRFQGKSQSEEAWLEVFSYYLELSLGIATLMVISDLLDNKCHNATEQKFCKVVCQLFDSNLPTSNNLADLIDDFEKRRRDLDYHVNNVAFTGQLVPAVTASRGKIIFGIPKVFQSCFSDYSDFLFSYQLDELENLSESQQKHINTLVRARHGPATFKIGARQFGIKTHQTMSANEKNIKDSEFDELRLDLHFRNDEGKYIKLVEQLVELRLKNFWNRSLPMEEASRNRSLKSWFEEPKRGPLDPFFMKVVRDRSSFERPHMQTLKKVMLKQLSQGRIPGIQSEEDIETIINRISVYDYPLLEKLNTTLIFNAWAHDYDLLERSISIESECKIFICSRSSKKNSKDPKNTKVLGQYEQKLGHYKSDLIAQMSRENSFKYNYGGLEEFTRMSEGQPRALITLLKQTFDWAAFQGEQPFEKGSITLDAETKGALAAAEWFYNSIGKAGSEGQTILIAINRLAELFRINRFANNPIECSLIGFSVSACIGSDISRKNLNLALDRSFIVKISGGQRERNSKKVTDKYQINRMLVPKWGLATARRGIKTLNEEEMDAIFDPSMEEAFEKVKSDWNNRMNAPFRKRRPAVKKNEQYNLL